MKRVAPSLSRPLALACLLTLLPTTMSFAQTAAPGQLVAPGAAAPAPSSLPDRVIQRIRTEDASTRIDELRVGGETQSITVQPKAEGKLPPYEVKPAEGAKGGAPSPSSGDTNGARVWNLLKF